MKRAFRRFVGKLTGRNKYIFFIVLLLVCIVALSLGIYGQFFYKYSATDPLMIGINIGAEKTAEEYAILESNFNDLFNNSLRVNSEDFTIDKLQEDQDVVYTAYDLVNEDETFYNVDAKIPLINIDSEAVSKINNEIKNEYYNKANSIMRQTEGNTNYKVTYEAFINSDYLSLVIKSVLKETDKSEKVTIKTYVYGMSRKEMVTLEDLIELKGTTKEAVQINIDDEIEKANINAQIIAEEYGTLYERDLNSEIYNVDESDVYFLTDDGYVYIVYPYGNTSYTNEMDIVIF